MLCFGSSESALCLGSVKVRARYGRKVRCKVDTSKWQRMFFLEKFTRPVSAQESARSVAEWLQVKHCDLLAF